MEIDAFIQAAIAIRTAKGLSVETTGIAGRDEPFTRHFVTAAERDAYTERCRARGETTRILIPA